MSHTQSKYEIHMYFQILQCVHLYNRERCPKNKKTPNKHETKIKCYRMIRSLKERVTLASVQNVQDHPLCGQICLLLDLLIQLLVPILVQILVCL